MAKSDDKADVWMPLYIGDYLADTTRLTTEQHGAYLLLIMDYWRNGPPPDEKIVLQQVTRLTDFLFKKHWPVLQKFFHLVDGHWHHKRIDAEMADALSSKASASEKARNAANTRWAKPDARSILQAHAPEMLEECPSPSPSPISKTESHRADADGKSPACARPSELSAAMRRHSIEAQPGDPRIIAAAEAGISVETVEAACAEAKSSDPQGRVKAGFVIAIAERWTREAAAPRGSPNARASPAETRDERRRRAAYELTHPTITEPEEAQYGRPDDRTIDAEIRQIG